jgi:hypothetical protein
MMIYVVTKRDPNSLGLYKDLDIYRPKLLFGSQNISEKILRKIFSNALLWI